MVGDDDQRCSCKIKRRFQLHTHITVFRLERNSVWPKNFLNLKNEGTSYTVEEISIKWCNLRNGFSSARASEIGIGPTSFVQKYLRKSHPSYVKIIEEPRIYFIPLGLSSMMMIDRSKLAAELKSRYISNALTSFGWSLNISRLHSPSRWLTQSNSMISFHFRWKSHLWTSIGPASQELRINMHNKKPAPVSIVRWTFHITYARDAACVRFFEHVKKTKSWSAARGFMPHKRILANKEIAKYAHARNRRNRLEVVHFIIDARKQFSHTTFVIHTPLIVLLT